jgi:hypothetical protein
MREIKILTDALSVWGKRYRNFGDYSVTTLLNPVRMVQLLKRYGDKVEREPAKQISAFIGSGVHAAFEDSLKLQSLLDSRYDVERTVFDKIEDRLVAGKFDVLFDNKHLYDIKTCKTWKKIFDPNMEEWHKQLNIYAYLLKRRGVPIKSINIIAIYLDWQVKHKMNNPEYPPESVVEYELTMWEYDNTDAYLRERVSAMKAAEEVPDDALPYCTNEEMWARDTDTSYAVMPQEGAARALKVCHSMQDAVEYARGSKSVRPAISYIEVRKPLRKRCEEWCDVNKFCNQYAAYLKTKEGGKVCQKIML